MLEELKELESPVNVLDNETARCTNKEIAGVGVILRPLVLLLIVGVVSQLDKCRDDN